MAGYNLSESIAPAGPHSNAHGQVHDIVNKFDKDDVPTDGQTWVYRTANGVFRTETPTGGGGVGSGFIEDPADPGFYISDSGPLVNVKGFGAIGNGSTDDSTAIIAARDAVLSSRTGSPITDTPQTPTLYFPPGVYKITTPDALLPTGGNAVLGYRIKGSGPQTTKILFQPSGGSSTLTNMNLMTAQGSAAPRLGGLRIEDIWFDSNNTNASFAYFHSNLSTYVQDTWFSDVRFSGTWKRILGLDGDATANLNSEMRFDRINTNGATFSSAFMYSGLTTPGSFAEQDQFLNYTFNDCKMEQVSGDTLVFDKGGFILVNGGSWIHSGAAGGTHFKMGNYSHYDGMQVLRVNGVRFELRNTNSRVIDCSWRIGGKVTFDSCSDESFGNVYQLNGTGGGATNYDTHIYRTPNNEGPLVRYQNCQLMCYHRVVTTATIPTGFKLVYDGCNFRNMQGGGISLLSSATNQFIRHDSAAPKYRYQDCLFTTDANVP